MRKLIFLMLLTFMFTGAFAQPNLAFYPFYNQFNSFDYNPAFLTSNEKFTFSIFPLGGTSIGYNNQHAINNLTSKFLSGAIADKDLSKVLNSIVNQSSFHQNFESSLLSFTYRSDIGFFNFRIKESESILGSTDGELAKFIFKSDAQGVPPNQIQHLPAQAVHYREYSLGYAYKSRDNRFTAGIRAKVYYGKSGLFSNISGSVHEEPNPPNNYVLNTSGLINVSFPLSINKTLGAPINTIDFSKATIYNYIMNTSNPGMGVDLGIKYQIMPNLILSASIIDLGKIKWKTNPSTWNLEKVNTLPNSKSEGKSYLDQIKFDTIASKKIFSKPLPAKLYAGIKYQLSPIFSINITDRLILFKDLIYNSLSVQGKFDVNKILSFSTGYSIIGDAYLNIPLAFQFRGNFGQVYLGTDNLTSILLPNYGQFAGFSFGACFYLFTQRNLYLKPSNLTPFYKPRKIIKNRRTGLTDKANQESN